jgi:hypothetical protein
MKFSTPELPHFDVPKIEVPELDISKIAVAKNAANFAKKAAQARGYLLPEKKPSVLTRFLHDFGLAVWFGGSVFGILSLNPSVEVLDDPEERGKMVDEAWARFQPYGALGMLLAFITHVIIRRREPRRATSCYKTASLAKDFFMVGAIGSSIASLALGEYVVDDYTPVESATEGTEETPEDKEKAQSGLSVAAIAQLICGVGLIACAAYMSSERDK